MKFSKTLFLLPALISFNAVNAETLCIRTYAEAIAMVETANDPTAIGRDGERSRYQFMNFVWKEYSNEPFETASTNAREANRVFMEHVKWSVRALKVLDQDVTVYNLALLHNAGFGNIQRSTVQERHRNYAKRVTSLYYSGAL